MTSTTLRLSKSDRTVALRDHGAGDPVVLVHGVGMQSAAWGPQIDALAKDYRVIAVDMPGHGGSDPLPEGSSLTDYVAWCSQVIEELGLGPVALVGHSMGALIAAGFAIEHPSSVTRVALLNGVFKRNSTARNAVIARASTLRDGEIDLKTPLDRWFGDSAVDQAARNQVAGWLSDVNLDGYATAYTAFAYGDATYADRISEIECPFLALTADGDQNSTPEMSHAMAKLAKNGRAVVIHGHRHMVNLTAADEVNTHLLDWLHAPVSQKELQ